MSLVPRVPILLTPLLILACARGVDLNQVGGQGTGVAVTSIVTLSIGDQEGGTEVPTTLLGDGSDGAPDTGGLTSTGGEPIDECAALYESAMKQLPADIILVIDNSGSMKVEAASVKANMNKFSSKIIDSGVDVHVVLISSIDGKNGMCIDPPLGGGGCPLDDTKLPTFLHIDHKVSSNNPLQKLLDDHELWKGQMRPDARKHVVVVSDDNSDLGSKAFDAAFKALDPSYEKYRFHAIVGKKDATDQEWCAKEPECCNLTAAAGEVYLNLIKKTKGVYGDLCKQDFTPVFNALSKEVIQNSGLACEWAIPEPMGDEVIDFNDVHVDFNDGMGELLSISQVADHEACKDAVDGWHFNDPNAPTKLMVCPQTCTKIQLAPKGSMSIKFGCNPLEPQ